MSSASAAARLQRWIETLPGQGFFFAHEIPDWSPAVGTALDQIAADPGHPVVRVEGSNTDYAEALYCKRWHESCPEERRRRLPSAERAILHIGGKGAGLAEGCALNRVGWSKQIPVVGVYACVGPARPVPWTWARLVSRDNTRRLELNQFEIAFIEAVLDFRWADISWDAAMERAASGVSVARLTRSGALEPDRIAWAAETEPNAGADFRRRIDQLCRAVRRCDSEMTISSQVTASASAA